MTQKGSSGAEQISAVAGISTAVAVAWLALRDRKDIPNEMLAHLDAATMELLMAMAAVMDSINKSIKDLQIGVQGFPPNCETFVTWQFQCPAALTAYNLPNFPIPDGFALLVKGHPNNPGTLYIGRTATDCSATNGWPLLAQEMLGLAVKNAQAEWVSASAVNQVLCCVVEQRQ